MHPPPRRLLTDRLLLGGLIVLCLLLRITVLRQFWPDLTQDPDTYLSLAQGISRGIGFCIPGTDRPTAFRPPLYPLMLVPVSANQQQLGRAVLHLLLACATTYFIWKAGAQLGLSRTGRVLATGLYVSDPLSLRYIAYPMTETFCAFWVAWLIVRLTSPANPSPRRSFCTGLIYGLCVLSRPTFWAFGIAYAVLTLFVVRARERGEEAPRITGNSSRPFFFRALSAAFGIALCVAPWVIRNQAVLGAPILMTTHGGYTLLLGNNDAFYREVVQQPLGTIWDGSRGAGQAAWIGGVLAELQREGITTEVQEDRWMSARAWQTIRQQPRIFLKASLLKFFWFWNIVPHPPAAGAISPAVLWCVGTFYCVAWLMLIIGLLRILLSLFYGTENACGWGVPVLFIASLTAAHLFYWSDARMRAPIVPAISLIAAAAAARRDSQLPADSAGPGESL